MSLRDNDIAPLIRDTIRQIRKDDDFDSDLIPKFIDELHVKCVEYQTRAKIIMMQRTVKEVNARNPNTTSMPQFNSPFASLPPPFVFGSVPTITAGAGGAPSAFGNIAQLQSAASVLGKRKEASQSTQPTKITAPGES